MTETLVLAGAKIPRDKIVAELWNRDGAVCMYPNCSVALDIDEHEGPLSVTIDHWMPQWYGKEMGWTREEIWDLPNLKLMHKRCNAKKGDLIPNEDGTLPEKPMSNFRYRRHKRANRPDGPCPECDNGHNLSVGEVCASCGVNAQQFPREAKMKYGDCDHEIFWCWSCSIGVTPRPAAVDIAVRQGESGEWD